MKNTQNRKFSANEIIQAKYIYGAKSRSAQFRESPTAYKVNPDGSISSFKELNYFNK